MSAQLQHQVASEAGVLASFRNALCRSVPALPETIDLTGRTAIITGASGGLGLEASRQFLQQGLSHLIVAVRSQTKGDAAVAALAQDFPKAKIEAWLLEMESDASIQSFARRCESLACLDIVILNVGVSKLNFERTNNGNGREMTLLVNYISTMRLAILMVPILKAKARSHPGRLTVVGSDTSYWVDLPETSGSLLDAIDTDKSYNGLGQYGKAKLLLIMAIAKLSEIVSADEVVINYFNPGATRGTGLSREATGILRIVPFLLDRIVGRDIVDSARQYLHSAVVLGKESHGSWTDFAIRPYPKLMYADAGRQNMDKLWDETLVELGLNKDSIWRP